MWSSNLYGMGTSIERHSAVTDLSKKAEGYCIGGERIDGMDVLAVRERVSANLEIAREEGRPTLVEAFTYRYRGHSAADPEIYRDKKEVEEWQEKDPIEAFIRVCVEGGRLEDGDVEEIRAEADRTVVEAVEFADASPEPPLETLYDGLYVVGETMGWYAVDERSPEPHRGEFGEDAPDIAKVLAESGAEHPSDQERQDRPGVRG